MDGPRAQPSMYIKIQLQMESADAPSAMTQINGVSGQGIKFHKE
jgi:hypothetical protein